MSYTRNMRLKNKKVRKNNKKKILLIIIPIVVATVAAFGILEASGKTHFFGNDTQKNGKKSNEDKDRDARTTSDAPTAQEDFTGGNERQPNSTDKASEGTVTSTDGNISTIPPQGQWTTSPNGVITVYSPANGEITTNGSTISGKTTVLRVSFRLIDDVSGVIAQGDLPVVNGTFSGTFSFSTTGKEGRLDVFSTQHDGTEINNVEVPIRFR